eukprot:1908285-Prymnesium_polylepis.1
MRLTEDGDSNLPPLSPKDLRKMPILAAIAATGTYTIHNHDALFLEQEAELSNEEKNSARNDLNAVLVQQPRTLETPDGEMTQVILPGNTHFEPPYE